jgi:hypothetical protein
MIACIDRIEMAMLASHCAARLSRPTVSNRIERIA